LPPNDTRAKCGDNIPIARAQFAKAGIDVDQLAAQVQDEGAKSFVESCNDLMEVIVSKSAALREAS
jgi:transaldolase